MEREPVPGKVFEIRSRDVRRGEWWAAYIPPASEEGDELAPDDVYPLFKAADMAEDWMGQGVVNQELARGNWIGILLNPDEPVVLKGEDDEDT